MCIDVEVCWVPVNSLRRLSTIAVVIVPITSDLYEVIIIIIILN